LCFWHLVVPQVIRHKLQFLKFFQSRHSDHPITLSKNSPSIAFCGTASLLKFNTRVGVAAIIRVAFPDILSQKKSPGKMYNRPETYPIFLELPDTRSHVRTTYTQITLVWNNLKVAWPFESYFINWFFESNFEVDAQPGFTTQF